MAPSRSLLRLRNLVPQGSRLFSPVPLPSAVTAPPSLFSPPQRLGLAAAGFLWRLPICPTATVQLHRTALIITDAAAPPKKKSTHPQPTIEVAALPTATEDRLPCQSSELPKLPKLPLQHCPRQPRNRPAGESVPAELAWARWPPARRCQLQAPPRRYEQLPLRPW